MQALLNTLIFLPIIFGSGNASAQEIPEPTPIVTPEPTPEPEYHIPECGEIEENNKPGRNEDGAIVMCNPLIFGAYPNTAPWSFFNDDFTILFEDGSYRAQIWTKGKFCPEENGNYCTMDVGDCAYPAMGCTP